MGQQDMIVEHDATTCRELIRKSDDWTPLGFDRHHCGWFLVYPHIHPGTKHEYLESHWLDWLVKWIQSVKIGWSAVYWSIPLWHWPLGPAQAYKCAGMTEHGSPYEHSRLHPHMVVRFPMHLLSLFGHGITNPRQAVKDAAIHWLSRRVPVVSHRCLPSLAIDHSKCKLGNSRGFVHAICSNIKPQSDKWPWTSRPLPIVTNWSCPLLYYAA